MKDFAKRDFVKTTVVGGLLFLLPVVLILFFVGYAVGMLATVFQWFSTSLQLGSLGAMGVVILALLLLVLVSFAAGVVATTEAGGRFTVWLETTLLGGIPQYQLLKGMAQGLAHIESANNAKPVLVSINGGWQIGYQLESLENGWVTVFLPQAPKPALGNVMYIAADRVRPLGITVGEAMGIVTSFGVGSREALRGCDLDPAKAQ